jgi:alkane 1-monooxygenase
MTSVGYPHFCVEHVQGHHRRVATPDDPASARAGEGLYAFLCRCIPGSLASACALERARCGRHRIRWWSLRNRRLRWASSLVLLPGAAIAVFGWPGLAFLIGQGVVAVLMLEAINYIEHYGLRRRELAPGRWERVGPQHSWNSSHRVTGWYLFNLPRHADHHAAASRPYYRLRHLAESPQLPAGYAAMLLCAFVPPLWRRIMDPPQIATGTSSTLSE